MFAHTILSTQHLPTQQLPTQRLPTQLLPTQCLSTQLLPTQCLPTQRFSTQRLTSQFLPTQRLPTQYLPTGRHKAHKRCSESKPNLRGQHFENLWLFVGKKNEDKAIITKLGLASRNKVWLHIMRCGLIEYDRLQRMRLGFKEWVMASQNETALTGSGHPHIE